MCVVHLLSVKVDLKHPTPLRSIYSLQHTPTTVSAVLSAAPAARPWQDIAHRCHPAQHRGCTVGAGGRKCPRALVLGAGREGQRCRAPEPGGWSREPGASTEHDSGC